MSHRVYDVDRGLVMLQPVNVHVAQGKVFCTNQDDTNIHEIRLRKMVSLRFLNGAQ